MACPANKRFLLLKGGNNDCLLELEIKDGEELKLVCNPFQDRRLKEMNYMQTYDLHHIGVFKGGQIKIGASYHPSSSGSNHPTLLVSIFWRPGPEQNTRVQDRLDGTLTLPLWFDKSTRCVLVVEDEVKHELPPMALISTGGAETDVCEVDPPPETGSLAATKTTSGAMYDIGAPVAHTQPNSAGRESGDVIHAGPAESTPNTRAARRPRRAHRLETKTNMYAQYRFSSRPELDGDEELQDPDWTLDR